MLRPHNRAERGLPAANTPRVRRPRDPRLRIAHGERSRRRVCRVVPGAASGRAVFLLVPAVRPRLAGALRERGIRISYVPVDTSQALLEMACGGALRAGFAAQGIKADFTRLEHREALAAEPETPPRLVILIGNTLGAFDPIAAAGELARLLRPGDLLLVDGELYAGDATMAGYDNPLNRRFAWAPLHAGRDIAALMGGELLRLSQDDRLDMSHSYKYAPDTFLRILSDAGLAARWKSRSLDGRFLMVLAGLA